MHNTERLHLPIVQCLSNDNSPMFIDPYNAGPIYIARTLRSAVYCTTVLWHAVRVLYCIIQYYSLQSNIIYYTECCTVQYSAACYIIPVLIRCCTVQYGTVQVQYYINIYILLYGCCATETGTTQQHHRLMLV